MREEQLTEDPPVLAREWEVCDSCWGTGEDADGAEIEMGWPAPCFTCDGRGKVRVFDDDWERDDEAPED